MGIGFGKIILILLIVLIFFGAGKLPTVMKDLAKGIKTFRDELRDDEEDAEPVAVKRVASSAKKTGVKKTAAKKPAAKKAVKRV